MIDRHDEAGEIWLFGYGSLIWRPGFATLDGRRASAAGFVRRFWQASHDHRGTPEKPGRVVTLVPQPEAVCVGWAWRVAPVELARILQALDHREKDGYERVMLPVQFDDGQIRTATTWLAGQGNPSWAGDTGVAHIASIIAASHGPSGANAEYLMQLAAHLDELDAMDDHVLALVEHVKAMQT